MTLCQTLVKVKEQTHPRRGVINHTQTGEVEFLHKHISCVRGEAGRRLANPISHGFRLRLKAEAASYCQHTQTNQGQREGGSLRAIHGAIYDITNLHWAWFVLICRYDAQPILPSKQHPVGYYTSVFWSSFLCCCVREQSCMCNTFVALEREVQNLTQHPLWIFSGFTLLLMLVSPKTP